MLAREVSNVQINFPSRDLFHDITHILPGKISISSSAQVKGTLIHFKGWCVQKGSHKHCTVRFV